MAKPKFFRVAVEGDTVDGRKIEKQHLLDIAATYNRATYGARGNVEHIRGATGEPPFGAVCDVLAVKTQEDSFTIGGKTEKRLALYAQLEPTEDGMRLNKRKQKVFTSIEVNPDFAKTGKAGLMGIAFTDSPASIGTERLEFTARAKAYGNLVSESQEVDFTFEDDQPAPSAVQNEAISAFTAMKEFFSGKKPTEPTPPAVETPPVAPSGDLAAFGAQIMKGMELMSASIETASKANTEATAKVAADLEAFKTKMEAEPSSNYSQRPLSTGGDGEVLAVC